MKSRDWGEVLGIEVLEGLGRGVKLGREEDGEDDDFSGECGCKRGHDL